MSNNKLGSHDAMVTLVRDRDDIGVSASDYQDSSCGSILSRRKIYFSEEYPSGIDPA